MYKALYLSSKIGSMMDDGSISSNSIREILERVESPRHLTDEGGRDNLNSFKGAI